MLFLKRLNDQFLEDPKKLRAEYTAKGLKPGRIEKQLANPDKYEFFVPDAAHWSYTDEKGRNHGIAHLTARTPIEYAAGASVCRTDARRAT